MRAGDKEETRSGRILTTVRFKKIVARRFTDRMQNNSVGPGRTTGERRRYKLKEDSRLDSILGETGSDRAVV